MTHHSASTAIASGRLATCRGRTHGLSIRHVDRSVFATLILIAIAGCATHQMVRPFERVGRRYLNLARRFRRERRRRALAL